MKPNTEKSIMVDVRQFFGMTENFDAIMNFWEERRLSTDIIRERFAEIQQATDPVPDWIRFLFRAKEDEKPSFYAARTERIGEFSSLDQLLARIEDRDGFFEALADYYVPDAKGYVKSRLIDGDTEAWYRECQRRGIDMSDRVQLLHLCGHYDVLLYEARDILIRVYHAVKRMHEKMADTVGETLRQLEREDVREKIRKFAAADLDPDDLRISVCLLNPYAFAFVRNKENRIVEMFAGDRFLEGTVSPTEQMDQDFLHFVVACGTRFKIEAVSLILKNGRMTITQLAEAMGTQTAIIMRPVSSLVGDGILCREQKEGRNVYYSINKETYRAVKRSAMEFLKNDY